MKRNYAKKILIIFVAVVCAALMQASTMQKNLSIVSWLDNWWNSLSTTAAPDTTASTSATQNPNDTTTTNPVVSTGSGTVVTQSTTTTTYYYTQNNYTTVSGQLATTTTTTKKEDDSTSFHASLTDMFESDSAAMVVVPTSNEPYTLNAGLVVNDTDTKNGGFTWQTAALLGAAVLFVILAALIIALLTQKNKLSKNKKETPYRSAPSSEPRIPKTPKTDEVVSPARLAEILGSDSEKPKTVGYSGMSSEESAAAIRSAAVMSHYSSVYSDPLMKKYTDEPVTFSDGRNIHLDENNVTGAEILKATESMISDLDDTPPEGYVPSSSHVDEDEDDGDDDNKPSLGGRVCPSCKKPVSSDDMFCHNCGSYVG